MRQKTNFKVGDLVRIRSWEDMAEEFEGYKGLIGHSLNCEFGFTQSMKILCGKEFRITSLCGHSGKVEGLDTQYTISKDMIELVERYELGFSVRDIKPSQLLVFKDYDEGGKEVYMLVGVCKDSELGFVSECGNHWWMSYHLNKNLRNAGAELIRVYSPPTFPKFLSDFTTSNRTLIWEREKKNKKKVFSKEKFYSSNPNLFDGSKSWVELCDGLTEKEMNEKGYISDERWMQDEV